MVKAPLAKDELEALERLAPDGAVVFELGYGAGGAARGAAGAVAGAVAGAAAGLRGAVLHGTRAIAQMRANHRLSTAGTVLLGKAYLCAGLLSASLKGGDAVALRFDGDGAARGLSVEARAGGLVRGRLFSPAGEFPPSGAGASLGAGALTVSRNVLPGAPPYVGTVAFSGGVDESLSAYYRESEQTPSVFRSSVLVGPPRGSARPELVTGAGAWYLQELPGALRGALERAAQAAFAAPDPSEWFSGGGDAEGWVTAAFPGLDPRPLGRYPFSFECDCSRSRFASFLGTLEPGALDEIAESGPFPLRIACHSCGSDYEFEKPELEAIRVERAASHGP